MNVDLNCDLGESFGRYELGDDAAIMPYITSANIACGLHAGDPNIMRATIKLAKQHQVGVGAHPGWPDLQGFGRREMSFTAEETEALVLYQIGALAGIAKSEGVEVSHVKPHGALYNQAAKDRVLADAVARAVKDFSPKLILVGLAGSGLIEAGLEIGIRVAKEGFPDRAYHPDGSLMSRNHAGAVIHDPEKVAKNAISLAKNGIRFGDHLVQVDTLCLHGDHPRAAENAKLIREALQKNEINIVGLNK